MVIWLVILAIMILIEAVTMGLTTVWFALGALGAAVVTGFGGGFWLQFTVFVILSFLSMIVFRPIAMRFFNPVKEKTNIDEIIGKKAVVIESIICREPEKSDIREWNGPLARKKKMTGSKKMPR